MKKPRRLFFCNMKEGMRDYESFQYLKLYENKHANLVNNYNLLHAIAILRYICKIADFKYFV